MEPSNNNNNKRSAEDELNVSDGEGGGRIPEKKTKHGHEQQQQQSDKKETSSTSSNATLCRILDEYICPISLELPVDPVTAEDGRIYERSAIKEWIRQKQGEILKSPMTNNEMGPRLSTATHVRTVIETALESGALPQDKNAAEKWMKRLERVRKINELKGKANQGDPEVMHDIACIYQDQKEYNDAFSWFKKASNMQHVKSMARVGHYLIHGIGISKNISEGLLELGCAASYGSDWAAYKIGHAYYYGIYDISKNLEKAKLNLTKVADGSCKYKHLPDRNIKMAKLLLEEVEMDMNMSEEEDTFDMSE